jgi:uncharacterized protein with HEPN domain
MKYLVRYTISETANKFINGHFRVRNLEIIGEAARNINEEIKNKYQEVPWRNMIGLRNILIHEYFHIDESIIWEAGSFREYENVM